MSDKYLNEKKSAHFVQGIMFSVGRPSERWAKKSSVILAFRELIIEGRMLYDKPALYYRLKGEE